MGFIADIFTSHEAASAQKDASRDAANASREGTTQTVALQRDIFNRIWNGTQVQRDAGDAATRMMAQLMGLNIGGQTQQQPGQPQPQTNPGPQGGSPQILPDDYFGGKSGRFNNALAPQATPTGAGNVLAPPQAPGASPAAAQPFDATAWLRSTPGYQANFDAGQRSMNASLAARGGLLSGEAGREAMRYGADYNDRIYGDQFNRLAAIAGAGQTAQSQGGQAGQNYANQSGNALMQNAQNLSSSYYNRGNAISGFWGNVNGSIQNTTNQIGRAMMGGF